MMSPTTRGAQVLHKKVVRPLFLKYKDQIDAHLDKASNIGNDVANAAREAASDPSNIAKGLDMANKAKDLLEQKDD